MKKLELPLSESIRENLDTWCFEVGSVFENHTKDLAMEYRGHVSGGTVVDLGSGDGAANSGFEGLNITAVDINKAKLDKNTASEVVNTDFESYLETVSSIENVFMCHSLEHCVNADRVLSLLAEKVVGSVCIAVPAREEPHSVHHVSFEDKAELVLPGFRTVVLEERPHAGMYEYVYIGVKR